MDKVDTNFGAASAFVAFGLEQKRLGRRESASGPGSTRLAARNSQRLIEYAITDCNVRSILDLGCGDWNWMREVNLSAPDGASVSYEGWEAHSELVDKLNEHFASQDQCFRLADAVAAPFPEVDLVIARDILFHMRPDFALRIVDKVRASAAYFMATSFIGVRENIEPEAYMPIENWGFYKINMNVPPFSLAENMVAAFREPEECAHSGNARYICLYELGTAGNSC